MMMKKVLVHGMFGGGNIGDEAVCRASTSLCNSVFGAECVVSIFSSNVDISKHIAGFDGQIFEYLFPRLRFWRTFPEFIETLSSHDLLVIGGGGLLQDVHGKRLMSSTLFAIACALWCKTPVAILGLGVGPVRSWFLKKIGRKVLSAIPEICVRDEHSLKYLSDEIGIKEDRITLAGDIVPLMSDFSAIQSNNPQGAAFLFRAWPTLDLVGLKVLVHEALTRFPIAYLVAFEESDVSFYEDLFSGEMERITIVRPTSVLSACELLSSVDAIYSMRLHGCIIAQMLGKNFTAFVYDEKINEFCRLIEKHNGVFDCDDIAGNLHDCFSSQHTDTSEYMLRCSRNRTCLENAKGSVCKSPFSLFSAFLVLAIWGIFYGLKNNFIWWCSR